MDKDLEAPTLGQLLEAIRKIVSILGEDAEWHGYDDGSIVTYKDKRIICVYPQRPA